MIFEISCLKFSFSFSISTFSKQSFLGIFDFWLKTPPNYKSCSKNGQNHQFALLSFTFQKKNPLFDFDLFSRTFDMELPIRMVTLFIGYADDIFHVISKFHI